MTRTGSRVLLCLYLALFALAGFVEHALHGKEDEIVACLREMGQSTREGLHDLEPWVFASEFDAALDRVSKTEGGTWPVLWYRQAFAAVMVENWNKSLVYKVFVVTGVALLLGTYVAAGYLICKKRVYTQLGAGNILFALMIAPFLIIPAVLGGLACILLGLLHILGYCLELTAWFVVIVIFFTVVGLVVHYCAEKVLHAARGEASEPEKPRPPVDLGPEMGTALSLRQIESIDRIELLAVSDRDWVVNVVMEGGLTIRSVGAMPRDGAEKLRLRILKRIEEALGR